MNGFWKIINPDSNQQLRFEFHDGTGKFWKYKFNDNNELVEVEEIKQTLEVFKTKSGFKIDWSNGNRIGTSRIKILNSENLVFVRRDGKETKLRRIQK